MNARESLLKALVLGFVLALSWAPSAAAQRVPDEYEQYIHSFPGNRSLLERSLNTFGLTDEQVGPGFALIVGIDRYPKLKGREELVPAGVDVDRLYAYLEGQERFQEVVVLRNEAVTLQNLDYFLRVYFPGRLREVPGQRGRFLLAFSGHGIQEGGEGYFLKPTAERFDPEYGISFSVIKAFYGRILRFAHQSLVLVNACHSGAFLQRETFGQVIPFEPGHWAITAGSDVDELVEQNSETGDGSVFFEKFFAALEGRADTLPHWEEGPSGDGLTTVEELFAYLKAEIPIATQQRQTPRLGNISIHGDQGSFVFLDQSRKVVRRPIRESGVNLGGKVQFFGSVDCESGVGCYESGSEYQRAGNHVGASSYYYYACVKGDARGCTNLGYLFNNGLGLPQDHQQAAILFRQGCEGGNTVGCTNLGVSYQEGIGVPADASRAAALYEQACEGGESSGCTNLGYLYETGKGVSTDASRAAALFEQGCEGGAAQGCTNLGVFYRDGKGVSADASRAAALFEQGCEGGNEAGCSYLGDMYQFGKGVEVDVDKAEALYRQVCDGGHELGCDLLESLR